MTDDTDMLCAHVENGGIVIAHNAAFEIAIWNQILTKRFGWPMLEPEQCRCTMAMALAMSLPAALEDLAPALGLGIEKDMAGHRLMLQMCRPRSEQLVDGVTAYEWWGSADRVERLYQYCMNDVATECAAEGRMLPLSDEEQHLWSLDWHINNRGVQIDMPAVKAASRLVALEKERLDLLMRQITSEGVSGCTNHQQLTVWLKSRGVNTDSVSKTDVADLLLTMLPDDEPDLEAGEWTGPCRKALELRQEAAKTSNAKLAAMYRLAGEDGKVYNTKQYHAATTGRWGGRGVQTDNFPRPSPDWKPKHTEDVLNIIRGGK